ncbi:hypothetical protein INT43_003886 [Umbelopsis isabellina]|uniref:Xaa-Pro dipeptidyl-peptidase-like domain-containing protein n=1 Tax=Mortierella isabellina TaxID=91625 RepID=A0A8H7UHJ3_MORIS|nr:hypothetical protein INT43_003886 [Umbelopsis isabellina]
MTTRLQVQSLEDKTDIDVIVTFEGDSTEACPAIVIAHPYGPLGGSMANNVVQTLHRLFVSKNYVTASFNFRGAGGSAGRTSWSGMPERQDYAAVVEYLTNNKDYPPISSIILCGYSFGSMIAGSIDPPSQIPTRYLLISYPLGVMWALSSFRGRFYRERAMQKIQSASQPTGSPILFLIGERDQFTGLNTFKKWIGDSENDVVKVHIVPDADHFWFGKEDVLQKIVDSWLRS